MDTKSRIIENPYLPEEFRKYWDMVEMKRDLMRKLYSPDDFEIWQSGWGAGWNDAFASLQVGVLDL